MSSFEEKGGGVIYGLKGWRTLVGRQSIISLIPLLPKWNGEGDALFLGAADELWIQAEFVHLPIPMKHNSRSCSHDVVRVGT